MPRKNQNSQRHTTQGDTRSGNPRAARTKRVDGRVLCHAITTSGSPCKRLAMPGMTVCRSHGGGTNASLRASKRRSAKRDAGLWGIDSQGSSLSIEEELTKLARNKLTDITALRIKLGENPEKYYGMLDESSEVSKYENNVTGDGYTVKRTKRNSVHPLVEELHKSERELVQILRLLQDITGGTDELDVNRLKTQTARQVARLMSAFPGINVDEVTKAVLRND